MDIIELLVSLCILLWRALAHLANKLRDLTETRHRFRAQKSINDPRIAEPEHHTTDPFIVHWHSVHPSNLPLKIEPTDLGCHTLNQPRLNGSPTLILFKRYSSRLPYAGDYTEVRCTPTVEEVDFIRTLPSNSFIVNESGEQMIVSNSLINGYHHRIYGVESAAREIIRQKLAMNTSAITHVSAAPGKHIFACKASDMRRIREPQQRPMEDTICDTGGSPASIRIIIFGTKDEICLLFRRMRFKKSDKFHSRSLSGLIAIQARDMIALSQVTHRPVELFRNGKIAARHGAYTINPPKCIAKLFGTDALWLLPDGYDFILPFNINDTIAMITGEIAGGTRYILTTIRRSRHPSGISVQMLLNSDVYEHDKLLADLIRQLLGVQLILDVNRLCYFPRGFNRTYELNARHLVPATEMKVAQSDPPEQLPYINTAQYIVHGRYERIIEILQHLPTQPVQIMVGELFEYIGIAAIDAHEILAMLRPHRCIF